MRTAALAFFMVAGCAGAADSPDIQPIQPPVTTAVVGTVPAVVVPRLVPATAPPLVTVPNTVTVTEPPPLPAPTETAATDPAVTEPIPGPESELDPDNVCPQDPDEIAAGEPPHQPPCD